MGHRQVRYLLGILFASFICTGCATATKSSLSKTPLPFLIETEEYESENYSYNVKLQM